MQRFISTAIAAALFALSTVGCSKREAVDAEAEKEARAFFEKEGFPAPVSELWKASILKDTLICGRMNPVRGGERHRFYYDLQTHHGQVELKAAVTFDWLGDAMLAQNRELFDDIWEDNCAEADASPF
jgi:hypothetical protein